MNESIPKRSASYWSNPPFLTVWQSGTLALSSERQSARMSKIKKGGLDQYGPEHFEVLSFNTDGLEMVNTRSDFEGERVGTPFPLLESCRNAWERRSHC